jgi:N4-gp56 family major capsid protein
MAESAWATGNALTVKKWAGREKMYRDTVKESYFLSTFGSKPNDKAANNVLQVNTDLEAVDGDKVTFGIRMRFTGAGVTSGTDLEGKEEAMTTYDYSVTLEEYAHATKDKGPLDRKRPMFDVDSHARQGMTDWGAEKIDDLLFTALQASPTKIFYGGDATSVATLEAADLLTTTLISKVKTWARTGGNRTQTPLRPIKIDGKMYYVLLVHPDVLYDLEVDSTFAQARREAEIRSKENPLFTGSYAIWNGVVIHSHENIDIYTNGGAGSNINYSTCSFMGAQSLVWAWGRRPMLVQKEFDYGRKHGVAWSVIGKAGKPSFNSKDYGAIGVYVARTKISDA